MTHWIDQAVVWLLAALSAFFLILVLTGGSILLSIFLSFSVIFLLRLLLQRYIPEKKKFRRKKCIQKIEYLLDQWALANKSDILTDVQRLLPELFSEISVEDFIILQRMPQGEAFSENELLSLYHKLPPDSVSRDEVCLFLTCPLSENARLLLPRLAAPRIRIVDKSELVSRLLKKFYQLPEDTVPATKRKQHRSFSDRAAFFFQHIHPFRITMYIIFFTAMYLMTGILLHMLSAVLFTILLLCRLIAGRYTV